jgi:hypothetical protein
MADYRYILRGQFPNQRFEHRVRDGRRGVTVSARKLSGTWNAGTLPVKWRAPGHVTQTALDPSAYTIPAGGGTVRIPAADLDGVQELVGEMSTITNNDCYIEVVVVEPE